MSRWWRTRPDGRRRPSLWLVAIVVLAAGWWIGGGRKPRVHEPPALVRSEPVGQAVRSEQEIQPLGRAGWLEVLDGVLAKPAPKSGEVALPHSAPPPPMPVAALNALPTLAPLAGQALDGGFEAETSMRPALPAGEQVRVWFLDLVRTGHLPALVRLVVAEDVRFGGKIVLPRGVRLLGAVQGDDGDRLAVAVRRVQWPDGTTSAINGQVVDRVDGFAGVRAWVVPSPGWVQGLEVAEDAWGAAVGVLRARATTPGGSPWMATGPDFRETVAEAAARAATAAGRTRAEEWRRRYPAHLEIRPGTEARVVILEPYGSFDEEGDTR